MRPTISTTLLSLALTLYLPSLSHAQNAAAGGGGGAVVVPVQYPTVINGPSLVTADGTTTTVQQAFTQVFELPLAAWAFPTPLSGSVGLGTIQGQIGTVRAGG